MSWPGSWSGSYMPLGFATAQGDGTIERTNGQLNESAYPLVDNSPPYHPDFPQSPPVSSEAPPRPMADRSYTDRTYNTDRSSSATLLGGDYFQSPRPESFQTGYSYRKDSEQARSDTGQNRMYEPKPFKPWKQFFHLLGTGFARFLLTAGLVIALWKIIWTYNSYPILNTSQKRFFNFLVTAFSLALGLNLASSLKSVAVKSRWWILSWEKRPLDEVEAILGCHALTTVIKFGCKSMFKKPSITIACTLWLLINLATQAFVAALGLNWSLDSAIDSSSSVLGVVKYSNLTQFYFKQGGDSVSADQLMAHEYGDLAMNYLSSTSSDVPGRLPVVPPLTLYAGNYTDYWDFDSYSQYVFMDYPDNDPGTIGFFYSNRSIVTEAACESFPETIVLEKNGTVTMAGYNSLQASSRIFYVIPSHDGTPDTCGSRCAKVYALENDGKDGFAYSCNVTVGSVVNASSTRWAQSLSDNLAIMAAQSIALSGFGGSKASSTIQGFTYYHDLPWGLYLGGNSTDMEWLLRVHALGSIIGADKYNPAVSDGMPGLIPNQGVRLKLDHPEFIAAILGGIGGFHFLFFILAAWLANKVVVIDDSYLAIALLMRPVVDRMRDHGSLMNQKELCAALKHPRVMYGVVDKNVITGKIKHLEISEISGKPLDGWKGRYD